MQNLEIEFRDINKNFRYIKLAEDIIKKCFKEEKLNDNLYVSIILTDEKNIRKLNKQYREIDKETDVLSFPMFEKNQYPISNVSECLGDIVVSIPMVIEQAKRYGHGFEREFLYMIVHGFYHLMGYNHEEEQDKKEMRKKEEQILVGMW